MNRTYTADEVKSLLVGMLEGLESVAEAVRLKATSEDVEAGIFQDGIAKGMDMSGEILSEALDVALAVLDVIPELPVDDETTE